MKLYGMGCYCEAGFGGDRRRWRCLYLARKMYINCLTLENRRPCHAWSGCRPSLAPTIVSRWWQSTGDPSSLQPSLISLPRPVLPASLSRIPCSVARTPRPPFVLQLMADAESRYYGLWQSQRAWAEEGEDLDYASADTDNSNSSRAP